MHTIQPGQRGQNGKMLKPLPYAKGLPFFGQTFAVLRDPVGWGERQRAKYGDAYIVKVFFQKTVVLCGPDALEQVWLDKDQSFSTAAGYRRLFGHLTDTSLLMMDFAEHRRHRKALNPAFKAEVMKGYLAQMDRAIRSRMKDWTGGEQFKFYPAIKALTLDVATDVFFDLPKGDERKKINQALTDILASALAVIRLSLPGTRWAKGLKAQRKITNFLRSQIDARRTSDAEDVFTRLCHVVDEDGKAFTDDEILGHLMTLWIAGHDTLASGLSTLVCYLGKNPEWQAKLAEEIAALSLDGRAPTLEDMKELPLCGYAFREALRIMPPAIAVPRGTRKDTSFRGYHIPAGIQVSASIYAVHHDEKLWPDPEKFDPMRFAPENIPADRSRFAWAPFGGGAHKCIGMVFAETQAKCFLVNLLGQRRILLPEGYEAKFSILPTPRPADGMPLRIIQDM